MRNRVELVGLFVALAVAGCGGSHVSAQSDFSASTGQCTETLAQMCATASCPTLASAMSSACADGGIGAGIVDCGSVLVAEFGPVGEQQYTNYAYDKSTKQLVGSWETMGRTIYGCHFGISPPDLAGCTGVTCTP